MHVGRDTYDLYLVSIYVGCLGVKIFIVDEMLTTVYIIGVQYMSTLLH